jgi:excisionase family DNA binding protein
MTTGSGQPVEIVIRLQLELPPGMTLTTAVAPDEPLAYRVPEAAEKLALGTSKVHELIARGDLGSVLIDGARRIPADELRAYLVRLRVTGDAA